MRGERRKEKGKRDWVREVECNKIESAVGEVKEKIKRVVVVLGDVKEKAKRVY